jgi:uncharacterized membrane protein
VCKQSYGVRWVLDARGGIPVQADEERLNQEWEELLEELRVLLPGTEVLFAFLLTLPFTQRFASLSGDERNVYFVAFLTAATATLLLVAPGAQHRLLWRHALKNKELRVATVFAITGTAFLAIAVASVVYLVTGVLYDDWRPALATGIAIALVLLGWYGVPLVLRLRSE